MKIVDSVNFVMFYDRIKDHTMAASTAYRLSKLYIQAKQDYEFYQEKLMAILHNYGELDENGNLIPTEDGKGIRVQADKQDECLAKVNELQDIESTINFTPIPFTLLEGLQLTPSDLEGIMCFFD